MDAEKILNYLSMVSNKNITINLIMHFVIAVAVLSVLFVKNEKLKKVIVNSSIFILFLSVSTNALIYGNPFHLITFLMLLAFAGFELVRGRNIFSAPHMSINTLISIILISIGIWYPEFVNASKLQLLFLSPVGIVPCPTLLTALGLLNLSYPKVNKLQYLFTIAMGIIYGIIGTFVFKVYLDISLLFAGIYSLINLYRFKINNQSEKKAVFKPI